ncbi:winged helix-turn-helix domain-containing protein [Phenylobacterium sp.]|uniref:winged helix-turn-helix domain-containing protein n=1 Tax=Phenylobacterium sp. TaxID=1871053 RepID=UPI00120EE1BD|nr:winged helix-turn-helix domain-containing protein [Phenylobacterium sp.]THD63011.1 MAG: hypothetical protein E8A49_06595 [Phenylobacterium sp.]
MSSSVNAGRIDLSQEPDFDLGALRVRPSRREVEGLGAAHVLQPRIMQVLVALAHPTAEVVSQDELVQRCWAGLAVGDDAIRRGIAELRRLAATWSEPPFKIMTVAGVGYRLEVTAAAAGEASPIAFGAGPRAERPMMGVPGRRTGLLAAAALLMVCACAATAWGLRSNAVHRVLSVEPLHAAGGDAPAQEVMLGLSGDLTHALVGNPAQIVVGQAGEASVRSKDVDLIVSGNVATIASRLQAHVQLTNARGGAILWANDFVGDPGRPDVLREQIATKSDAVINCALSTRHGGAARISDEANRLYLRACDFIEQYRLNEALEPLRQVTVLEPRFARAWADLATTQALTVDGSDPARDAATFREATANARRALALDPKTGIAYYAIAQTLPGIANWQRRVDTIGQGLKVEPDSSELNNAMAKELKRVGRSDEAIVYYRRSMAADPLDPVKTATLFSALAFDGQTDEAQTLIDRALRLWPQNAIIWDQAFGVELKIGDPQKARAMLDDPQRPSLRDPDRLSFVLLWLRMRQDPSAANIAAVTAQLDARAAAAPGDDRLPDALRLSEMGKIDAAYRNALAAPGGADEENDGLLFRASATTFRRDPRFMSLAARRGLVAIWRATGVWPDFCAGPSAPYDCRAIAATVR